MLIDSGMEKDTVPHPHNGHNEKEKSATSGNNADRSHKRTVGNPETENP